MPVCDLHGTLGTPCYCSASATSALAACVRCDSRGRDFGSFSRGRNSIVKTALADVNALYMCALFRAQSARFDEIETE
jgi:hypothetical protein